VSATDEADDTIQVMEFWFKQPFDTMEVPAGAVACTIQAGGHEVRYIPQYWQRTGRQNQLFPFVHYWCIRDENEFYNKSELLPIMSLVDGADRELARRRRRRGAGRRAGQRLYGQRHHSDGGGRFG